MEHEDILGMFSGIFKQMHISQHELDEAEDALTLPELSQVEMSNMADKGIDMKSNKEFIEVSWKTGIFSYKKRPVVVYIRDQWLSAEAIENHRYSKYHLCYCKALKEAHQQHRFYNRYVMVRRLKGDFWMNVYSKEHQVVVLDYAYRKLDICQDCLRQLNWKNFNSFCGKNPENWWTEGDKAARQKIVNQFNITEFLHKMRERLRKENSSLEGKYTGKS